MSIRSLEQGIQAIQNQHLEEGARLIRIALRDEQMDNAVRATALMWLAETNPDVAFKVDCYRQANLADPTNQLITQRLSALLQQQLPKTGNLTTPAAPNALPAAPSAMDNLFGGSQPANPYVASGNTPPQGNPAYDQYGQPLPRTGQPNPSSLPPYTPQQPANPYIATGNTPPQGNPAYDQYGQPLPRTGQLNPANLPPYTSQQPANPYITTGNTPPQGNPVYDQYGQPIPRTGQLNPANLPPYNPYQTQSAPAVSPQNPLPQTGRLNPANLPPQGTFNAQNAAGMQPNYMPAAGVGDTSQRLFLQGVQRPVGVLGGPNGRGSGFFVTRDGLIATSRFVVGGETDFQIHLQGGQVLAGKAVRSFPPYDLALIQVNAQVSQLWNITQLPMLPDNAPIIVVNYTGESLRSSRRETRNDLPPHWFPTLINQLKDAGGDPVFDQQSLLVGMMTRNTSRTNNYCFGLHITLIYKCVEQYLAEVQQLSGHGVYCHQCGISSRAGAVGAYYCEHCGAVMPASLEITRHPQPNVGALYGENMNRPCPHCHSTVGYYKGVCQRCGQDVTGKA